MSLRDAMAGIKEAQESLPPKQIDTDEATGRPEPRPTRRAKEKPQAIATVVKTTAKSSNPDYQPLKVYAHKELRRKVQRKYEDAGGRDISDLVEKLFTEYQGT